MGLFKHEEQTDLNESQIYIEEGYYSIQELAELLNELGMGTVNAITKNIRSNNLANQKDKATIKGNSNSSDSKKAVSNFQLHKDIHKREDYNDKATAVRSHLLNHMNNMAKKRSGYSA